jgi:glycosyltransferase involved in cell wall biosynthesis
MLQLAQALNPERYEPIVYFTQPGPILGFAEEMGVAAAVCPMGSVFSYGAHVPIRARMLIPFLLHFRSTSRATQLLIRAERPDLVHLNTSVLVPAALGVKREGIPLVWHIREVAGPNRWIRRWQLGTIHRLADHVVTNSDYVRQEFGQDPKVTTIHNSVDRRRFDVDVRQSRSRIRAELKLPATALVVGMIGSVQKVKGHDLIVDAARRIVDQVPEVRFLIVAGGVDDTYKRSWRRRVKTAMRAPVDGLDRMCRRVRSAGLEDHFVFSGYRTDIPDMLAAMDVLAFPSQAPEGFGRPMIEAMAIGCPVVATDLGPTREIVGDTSAGLVEPGDSMGLANALLRVLMDRELANSIGEAGRRRFLERFDLDAMVAKVQDVYEEVISRTSAQPTLGANQ